MRANRREFLKSAVAAAVAAVAVEPAAAGEPLPKRKFTVCLACGMIGIKDDPAKVIGWARDDGFEAIEPSVSFLAKLSDGDLSDYLARMREAKLSWGAAGLPVQFKGDDAPFEADLKSL